MAYPFWSFSAWQENNQTVSASPVYSFTVLTNRTLTAVFTPQLQAVASGEDSLLLSWPAAATGFSLQSAETTTPSVWLTVTNQPATSLGWSQVLWTASSTNHFFRLFQP